MQISGWEEHLHNLKAALTAKILKTVNIHVHAIVPQEHLNNIIYNIFVLPEKLTLKEKGR